MMNLIDFMMRGFMKKCIIGAAVSGGFIFFILVAMNVLADEQLKGSEIITIPAGSMAPVNLPHHLHQNVLGDCNLCHDIFPQVAGSIIDLKNHKKLKKQQVMNTKCIQCHKANKEAGKHSGPTECMKCHVRS